MYWFNLLSVWFTNTVRCFITNAIDSGSLIYCLSAIWFMISIKFIIASFTSIIYCLFLLYSFLFVQVTVICFISTFNSIISNAVCCWSLWSLIVLAVILCRNWVLPSSRNTISTTRFIEVLASLPATNVNNAIKSMKSVLSPF